MTLIYAGSARSRSMASFARRRIYLTIGVATLLLSGCDTPKLVPAVFPPEPTSSTTARLAATDVDIACFLASHRALCEIDVDNLIVNPTDKDLHNAFRMESNATAARSVYVDGRPIEPLEGDGEVELAIAPRGHTHLLSHLEIALNRTSFSSFSGMDADAFSIWQWKHPTFGLDLDRYEYWPINYCFGDYGNGWAEPPPTWRHLTLRDGLMGSWSMTRASAEDSSRPERTWCFSRKHRSSFTGVVPAVANGGPLLNVGHVSGGKWSGELAYDVAIPPTFLVEIGVEANTGGEVEILPLFGLPMLVQAGVPVRVRPRREVGGRIQLDLWFPVKSVIAVGFVVPFEYWPADHDFRSGLLLSLSF